MSSSPKVIVTLLKIKKTIFHFLASLKLAVIVILGLAIVSATGTIVESRYDAYTAKKLVYESPWMYSVIILLVLNLIFSALDRIPWKKRHLPFLLAHVGIIIVAVGAYVTQKYGVDGSMAIGIEQTEKLVSVDSLEISLYQAQLDGSYQRLWNRPAEFFKAKIKDNPVTIPRQVFGDVEVPAIKITDFVPYARRDSKVKEAKNKFSGPGLRFQLQNPRTSVSDWVLQESASSPGVFDFGPARIVMTQTPVAPSGRNEIVISPTENDEIFSYQIFSAQAGNKPIMSGKSEAGNSFEVPWKMPFTFRVLNYHRHAETTDQFKPIEFPTPLTASAIEILFEGEVKWVGLNSSTKLFTKNGTYIFVYGNLRIPLNFGIRVDKFLVGRYPGVQMAKSYESHVTVAGLGERVISMNEPLTYQGYTFYQSSFQEDEKGKPVISVLSVNYDPGRWIKYVGCIFLVSGIIYLFFQRNRARKKAENASSRSSSSSSKTVASV